MKIRIENKSNEVQRCEIFGLKNWNNKSFCDNELIEVFKTTKASIEKNRNAPCILCLVEGPKIGYYFKEDKITFNESIPSGGTLITSDNKILALNVEHYI